MCVYMYVHTYLHVCMLVFQWLHILINMWIITYILGEASNEDSTTAFIDGGLLVAIILLLFLAILILAIVLLICYKMKQPKIHQYSPTSKHKKDFTIIVYLKSNLQLCYMWVKDTYTYF